MKRRIIFYAGTGLLAVALVVLAAFPSKSYTVDYRKSGEQFTIYAYRVGTPVWYFNLRQDGTNTFDGTGCTWTLRYKQDRDTVANTTITGTVSTTVVTFNVASNQLAATMKDGWAALIATSNASSVVFAEGAIFIDDDI